MIKFASKSKPLSSKVSIMSSLVEKQPKNTTFTRRSNWFENHPDDSAVVGFLEKFISP
jgi:hypothetical protein